MTTIHRRALPRFFCAAALIALFWFLAAGMGYRVEGLVRCKAPFGDNVTAKYIKTECSVFQLWGCDPELAIPMTDVSGYGECRIHLYSGFDPVIATLNSPKGVPVPTDQPNFTAKAGRHSQEVCSHWFPVQENGGKFEIVMSNYGPAGKYGYKVILECHRERPADGTTPSEVQTEIPMPVLRPAWGVKSGGQ